MPVWRFYGFVNAYHRARAADAEQQAEKAQKDDWASRMQGRSERCRAVAGAIGNLAPWAASMRPSAWINGSDCSWPGAPGNAAPNSGIDSATARRYLPHQGSMIVMTSYRKLLLIPALAIVPFLGGCVGMSIVHPGKFGPVNGPNVSCLVPDSPPHNPDCLNKIGNSCSELIRAWGAPAKTSISGQQRRLTYRPGRFWVGIRPLVLFPLPLAVPIGRNSVTFTCEGDGLIEASGITTRRTGFYCGIMTRKVLPGCDSA